MAEMNVMQETLHKLLNAAVTEGRENWDGYYGHDNSFHLSTLYETQEYKDLIEFLGKNL